MFNVAEGQVDGIRLINNAHMLCFTSTVVVRYGHYFDRFQLDIYGNRIPNELRVYCTIRTMVSIFIPIAVDRSRIL